MWLGLALSLFGNAQAEQLPVKIYTIADGLAHNHINRIFRDSRGFLWFCTDEGLSRFDGYHFASYTKAHGLPHNIVNDLLETRDGVYWVATDGGVCRFNPTGEPAPLDASLYPKASIRNPMFDVYHLSGRENANRVNRLLEDRDGAIWLATNDGLFLMRHAGNDVSFEEVEIGLRRENKNDPHISALAFDQQGGLWAGAIRGLFHRRLDGRVEHFTTQHGLPGEFVQTLFADRDGRLWAGTRINGFCRIVAEPDPRRPVVERCWTERDGAPSGDVRQIYRTRDGRLLLATRGGLSEISDTADGRTKFVNYTTANGLSENGVFQLAEDRDGNLWLGTFLSGVMRIARPGLVTYGEADGYHPNDFSCIFESLAGELIIVSGFKLQGAIHRFDGKRFTAIKPNIPSSRLDFGIVQQQGTFQDRDGEWWIPTDYGLARFPPAPRVEDLARARTRAFYTMKEGLPFDGVHSLYEDSHGDIWITTMNSAGEYALSCWERAHGTFHRYTEAAGLPSLKKHEPKAFREDGAGSLWVGFDQNGGLARYRNGRFDLFTALDGLPKGNLYALFLDHAGRLWIAASEGGLARIDNPAAERPRFSAYTTAEGLSSNEVWCVTEDHRGRIYIGTGHGLDRLEPETGLFKHYSQADGLAQGAIRVSHCDRRGTLWFVTNRGVSRLDPLPDRELAAPPVMLTGLRINGVTKRLSELGETAPEKLELTPQQNNVQIDFLGLDFAPGDVLRYRYWLEGADRDWGAPVEQRAVNYASLAPGSYRFLVRAVNADGVESVTPATVAFTILPPLWRRWWFLALAALSVGLLIEAVHRYRAARLLELERVRTRIASDLHDDIGSNLSLIAGLSEMLGQQTRRIAPQIAEQLAMIAAVSRKSVDAMSDIVWMTNPKKDNLSDLTQRMRRFASDALIARNVELRFYAPGAEADIKLGAELRREVFLIFKEAINNTARHAGCAVTEVSLLIDGGAINLKLSDDGCGFDPSRASEGQGMMSMRLRAERLGGKLSVTSQPGAGATVTLIAPLY